jgi:AcrR family transcriptional regulator
VAKAAPEELESRRLHPTAKKILAAARRILVERGYQALTLQAIATESGVNKAGVWYYFGGKEQLVLALLEEVAVTESHHFGARPAEDATLDERIDLIVGSAQQVRERVERFAAFYELLPEASRDTELRAHLMTYYQGWYAWAGGVLAPPGAHGKARARRAATLGQFASILLDGIFMQMVVAAPGFDLEAALHDARRTLRHLLGPTARR